MILVCLTLVPVSPYRYIDWKLYYFSWKNRRRLLVLLQKTLGCCFKHSFGLYYQKVVIDLNGVLFQGCASTFGACLNMCCSSSCTIIITSSSKSGSASNPNWLLISGNVIKLQFAVPVCAHCIQTVHFCCCWTNWFGNLMWCVRWGPISIGH